MGKAEAQVDGEGSGGDIQVIARIAALLECLDPESPCLDTQTTAKVLGVGRSTAHRYLVSLEKRVLLQCEPAVGIAEMVPLDAALDVDAHLDFVRHPAWCREHGRIERDRELLVGLREE